LVLWKAGASMKIGLAGLGRMGRAFVHRLSSQGYDLTVWNRSPLGGALPTRVGTAPTPKALAEHADLIITSLTADRALEDVYLGRDGLLTGNIAGKIFVETSTV